MTLLLLMMTMTLLLLLLLLMMTLLLFGAPVLHLSIEVHVLGTTTTAGHLLQDVQVHSTVIVHIIVRTLCINCTSTYSVHHHHHHHYSTTIRQVFAASPMTMMMMISASSWVVVLVLFISFWVDHVNSLHCSNHHLPAASSRVIQQQYPCSVRHRPTAIHIDMRAIMRHTRISRLSLVHPSFCTHSINSISSSNSRKEMALQAGAPGVYVRVYVCVSPVIV